jgi:hypothetical protein
MTIVNEPDVGADVPVHVTVNGECCHAVSDGDNSSVEEFDRPNRRFLAGDVRKQMAEAVVNGSTSASHTVYKAMGEMTDLELLAGNNFVSDARSNSASCLRMSKRRQTAF